jgi:hypothetical protein
LKIRKDNVLGYVTLTALIKESFIDSQRKVSELVEDPIVAIATVSDKAVVDDDAQKPAKHIAIFEG